MLLAHAYKLHIGEEKLSLYLLNTAHPDGSSKARFFTNNGFKNPADLQRALIFLAEQAPVTKSVSTPFGLKHIIDGHLLTLLGKQVGLRSVWIVLSGSDICTFVTAYPL